MISPLSIFVKSLSWRVWTFFLVSRLMLCKFSFLKHLQNSLHCFAQLWAFFCPWQDLTSWLPSSNSMFTYLRSNHLIQHHCQMSLLSSGIAISLLSLHRISFEAWFLSLHRISFEAWYKLSISLLLIMTAWQFAVHSRLTPKARLLIQILVFPSSFNASLVSFPTVNRHVCFEVTFFLRLKSMSWIAHQEMCPHVPIIILWVPCVMESLMLLFLNVCAKQLIRMVFYNWSKRYVRILWKYYGSR